MSICEEVCLRTQNRILRAENARLHEAMSNAPSYIDVMTMPAREYWEWAFAWLPINQLSVSGKLREKKS